MIYEFEKNYILDTGSLDVTGTGSGVHLYKDVSLKLMISHKINFLIK